MLRFLGKITIRAAAIAYPDFEGDVVIHHAIEQQVLKRYPAVILSEELHSLENLRGILKSINNDVHLSKITRM